MKKTLCFLLPLTLVAVLFSLFGTKIYERPELPEITLLKSFNSTGARVVSSEVYFWGRFKSKDDSLKSMEQLAEGFSKELGIMSGKSFSNSSFENDLTKCVEIKGINASNDLLLLVVQMDKQQPGSNSRIISVSVTRDLSGEGLDTVRKNVLKVFEKYRIKPSVNSCIAGSYDGKLEYDRLNEVCIKVFKEAEARKVEGIRENNLISVSAYTPFISDSIRVSGKKVNLNLAVRYNSYENKTYIWLATPVITTEY